MPLSRDEAALRILCSLATPTGSPEDPDEGATWRIEDGGIQTGEEDDGEPWAHGMARMAVELADALIAHLELTAGQAAEAPRVRTGGMKVLWGPRSSESRLPLIFLSRPFGFAWWTTRGARGRFIRLGWLCLRWGAA